MTDKKEKEEENKGEEKEEKKYKCKWPGCNASFERSVDLARHVRLAHKRHSQMKGEEKEKEKETETEAKTETETKEETKKEEEKAVSEEKPKSDVTEPEVPKGVKIEVQPSKPEVEVKTPPPERVDVTTAGVKPAQPVAPATSPQSPSVTIVETEEYKRRVREVKDRYVPVLLKYPQVVGVGVNRMPDGRLGIEILTCAECPQKELPKTLEGIPTFVHGINELRLKPVTTPKPEPERKEEEEEHAETLIDRIAYAKKFGIFFEGPVRKSLRKWLRRRREEKKKEREGRG